MSKSNRVLANNIGVYADDQSIPLGERIKTLREWKHRIEYLERELLIQLGVDVAKELVYEWGFTPTGQTIEEHFRAREGGE